MKLLSQLLTASALSIVTLSPALASQELAQKKACMACHGVDKKIVGPSYLDVAKKYKGQKDAQAKLVQKVLKGGAGSWGTMPMPANSQVNEAEANQLVKWVLSLK